MAKGDLCGETFGHNVFKSRLLLLRQNAFACRRGLTAYSDDSGMNVHPYNLTRASTVRLHEFSPRCVFGQTIRSVSLLCLR